MRAIKNVIYYLFIITFLSFDFICFASTSINEEISKEGAKNYLLKRIEEREKALSGFYQRVAIEGKPDAIQKFKAILLDIAENEIGCFVIKQINEALSTQKKDKPYKLNVQIDNICPEFVLPTVAAPYPTIKFSLYPMKFWTIPNMITGNQMVKTIQQSTPIDVILFHEFLHFARFIIVENYQTRQKEEYSQTINHSILSQHPFLTTWTNELKLFVEKIVQKKLSVSPDNRKAKVKTILLPNIAHLGAIPLLQPFIIEDSQRFVKLQKTGAKIIPFEEKQNMAQRFAEQLKKDRNIIQSNFQQTTIPIITSSAILQDIQQTKLPVIKVEEIRNIIGDPTSSNVIDKICENSYRLARNQYYQYLYIFQNIEVEMLNLRYGHNDKSCLIDKNVLKWCFDRAVEGMRSITS